MGICPKDQAATLGQAEAALKAAEQARVDLETDHGIWQEHEAGRAVRGSCPGSPRTPTSPTRH
jgi:hypothetical protein